VLIASGASGCWADGRRTRRGGWHTPAVLVLSEPAGSALPPSPAVSDHIGVPPAEPGDQLPPGTTTLRRWAARHGRTYDYLRRWRRREGFPVPVGELPARGRHGGGRGELLFDEQALDEWLGRQPDLEAPERFDLAALGVGPDDRITLGRFAVLIGKARNTVAQHRGRASFPEVDVDGAYRAGDLFNYWNTRSGHRSQSSRSSGGNS
jgi:hypothetical protein